MLALAGGKAHTGRRPANPVLITEGRVTTIDALLAIAVLAGLTLNTTLGWWWADPAAGLVIVYYAVREARAIFISHLPQGLTPCQNAPGSVQPLTAGRTPLRR